MMQDRQEQRLRQRFDAKIERTHERKYHMRQIPLDYSTASKFDKILPEYQTEHIWVIKMGERDLEKFFDYLDWLEQDSRHEPIQYDENRFIQYMRKHMDTEHNEAQLRKQYPMLQSAWEQYRAALALVK
jgi:hypothetical protein